MRYAGRVGSAQGPLGYGLGDHNGNALAEGDSVISKGTIIAGKDGQGYKFTRDVRPGDAITRDLLEPFGGAKEPEAGRMMPDYVCDWFKERTHVR